MLEKRTKFRQLLALNGFSFSAFAWARATDFLQGLCCGHQPGAAGTQLGWQVQPGVTSFLTGAMLLVGLNASHPRLLWVCKHGCSLCSACSRYCGVHSDFLVWGVECFWSLCCAHAGGGFLGHAMMMHAGTTGGFQNLPCNRQFFVVCG